MRLTFPDQKSAQAVADRLYTDMKAADVLEPGTTAWAVPARGMDEQGNPIGEWFIVVDSRCAAFLTSEEMAKVPELQATP